ncbi:MAG: hypothetical protein KGL18_02085 [Burkholderiales bacterium]|nr:hypothetical protein [Burkholderiales bacterium]MDE1928084.1 hypothetical protein [Burkholderiales bacterium]MDE2158507.1 hypothetical protein [Burkholderiales bacterium]MDE2501757.1 hypothetical protein [Burkholderiales bacterium]
MRIFPLALIAIGVFGVLKYYGLVDPAFVGLFWPLFLIALGVAMLARGPRWRADLHQRMQGRWERRMHRRFGPGWARLSEEERERFRAGMRQAGFPAGRCRDASAAGTAPPPGSPAPTPAPGEQR